MSKLTSKYFNRKKRDGLVKSRFQLLTRKKKIKNTKRSKNKTFKKNEPWLQAGLLY